MKTSKKMALGKHYEDLDEFFRFFYGRIYLLTPFKYPTFKNSFWKMCPILCVLLIAPIPNCILIYYEDYQNNLTLKFLQFSEMVLITTAEIMSFITVAFVAQNLESIHRKVKFIHALFQRKNAPIYSSFYFVAHDLSFILMVSLYVSAQLVYTWIIGINYPIVYQILQCLSTVVPLVAVHYLTSLFRVKIYVLYAQLSNLNEQLMTTDPRKPHKFECLVYGHCLINHVFKLLNSSFAIPMVGMSFCSFFIVVYNLYDMLSFNSEADETQKIGDNLEVATWIVMWTSELTMIVVLLEKLNEKNEGFSEILYYIVINDRTGILSRSPKLQMHFVMKQKLECNAGGFFTVDYRLLSTMVSSATTYLIILIQVSQVSIGKQ